MNTFPFKQILQWTWWQIDHYNYLDIQIVVSISLSFGKVRYFLKVFLCVCFCFILPQTVYLIWLHILWNFYASSLLLDFRRSILFFSILNQKNSKWKIWAGYGHDLTVLSQESSRPGLSSFSRVICWDLATWLTCSFSVSLYKKDYSFFPQGMRKRVGNYIKLPSVLITAHSKHSRIEHNNYWTKNKIYLSKLYRDYIFKFFWFLYFELEIKPRL